MSFKDSDGGYVMVEDYSLFLSQAIQEAGEVAKKFWRRDFEIWQKPDDLSPVSEADLAVNKILREILCAKYPDYGWLSEEDDKDGKHFEKEAVFIVDPIDGTRNFIKGSPVFAISIAIARKDQIYAGAVFLPECGLLFEAQKNTGATLNGLAIHISKQSDIKVAKVLAAKNSLHGENWRAAHPPPFQRHFEGPLSYRLCLVAEGRFDAMYTLHPTWEWDIAAGSLIAAEAGADVTDCANMPLCFNSKMMRTDGLVVGGRPIHRILIDALA